MRNKLNAAEKFFYDNAGWSYDPKTETSDEVNGRPYSYSRPGRLSGTVYSYVPDLETGALKRVAKVVSDRNTRNWVGSSVGIMELPTTLHAYHQTDPRGCSLYLVSVEQLQGADIASVYNRGFGVCI